MARQKKDKRTPEQIEQDGMNFNYNEMLRRFINEPTYQFNIGDSVNIGNLKDCIIREKHVGGKFYLVEYTSVDNNYGNPIGHKNKLNYWMWTDIRRINNTKESLKTGDEYSLRFMNSNVSHLLHLCYNAGLEMNPPYQREYVWNLEDQINLIDSIFNNVDIGKVVYVNCGYDKEKIYEILDGKQRVKALLDYYEDRFEYKGKKFSDLSHWDKNHFEDYHMSFAELREPTEEQKLKCFIKMNTAGKVMSKEDIQRAVDLLKKGE